MSENGGLKKRKSEVLSVAFRKEGDQLLQNGKFKEAVKLYNQVS